MRSKILIFVAVVLSFRVSADEGMWIPLLVEQQILPAMQEKGCKLSAEQIYSAEKACLKDAVVRIGQGCTGSFISDEGLVLTNYHCVQYFISKACEGGTNYLESGFFAHSKEEELPTSRLTVEILSAMFDVTAQVKDFKTQGLSMKQITDTLAADSVKDFQYSIEEMYAGNQYFMFKTKKYTDVRLVAFMPSDIAQFGGDVDNWKWPRNSADFALLRVYENNEPVHPKKSLKINAGGVEEGDFTMVMGYPAVTNMYGTQLELQQIYQTLNPYQIAMRRIRLQPIAEYMKKGEREYFECYSSFSSLANYYEKWQGEQYGIEHSDVLEKRGERDALLQTWISGNDSLRKVYGNLFETYNEMAKEYYDSYTILVLYLEGLWRLKTLLPSSVAVSSPDLSFLRGEKFISTVEKYNPELERGVISEMLRLVSQFAETDSSLLIASDFKNIDDWHENSVFTNRSKALAFQKMIAKKKFADDAAVRTYLDRNDELYRFSREVYSKLSTVLFPRYNSSKQRFDSVKNHMMNVVYLYNEGNISPDANSTMRVSFGKVAPYSANREDSTVVQYKWYSSEDEFLGKMQRDSVSYSANDRFVGLLKGKDFGTYQNNAVVMNFIATNQTSGGNSGSPVLDAYGNLIGVNFDRNWEGTMSDYCFDERFCRNISVDIRYILFCLEQYGKADTILRELSFVE